MNRFGGWGRFIAWQVLVFGLTALWRLAGLPGALMLLQSLAWLYGITGMLAAFLWPSRGLCQRSLARTAASAVSMQAVALLLLLNFQFAAALAYMLGYAGREVYRSHCTAARATHQRRMVPTPTRAAQGAQP